jgi:hypothetical protein
MEKAALAEFWTESVTVMLKDGVPVVVGLPLSTPAAERVRPDGSAEPPVIDHVYPVPDPPVAAKVLE